ncbi:MAG: methyltransferase domain-containing protein [Burkholderiales bacterium]
MNAPPRRAALASLLAAALAACSTGGAGDDTFRPLVGQAGKDVMWVPTLDGLVMPMLELAGVRADDVVYDLGSGDGKIPIWAARKYGARAVGIEYDGKLSALAQRNAERAGVTDRVKMIHGDIFKEDFSSATVLTLYLGEALNEKLRPTILSMKPGTRVVSNSFGMGTWEPDRTVRLPEQNPLFLWIVPERVGGTWMVEGLPEGGAATLRLEQSNQVVRGTLAGADGRALPVRGRLDGVRLALDVGPEGAVARRLALEARDDAMRGTVAGDAARTVTARRTAR